MQPKRFFYLIELQYLGFRFHGWQEQPNVITVERMVKRTLKYIFKDRRCKVIAAGRTDAMVSVNQSYIELFLENEPIDEAVFLEEFNINLPPDIRALTIQQTTADFNIIQHPKQKEYLYFFSLGKKPHPFSAAFMIHIHEELNIPAMQEAAKCFEGEHDFWSYCYRPQKNTNTLGKIDCCEIVKNTYYTGDFFPEESYVLRVRGKGFKRHQIRLMMGALIDLGQDKIDVNFIQKSLEPGSGIVLEHIAQASGLLLNKVDLI